MNIFLRIAMATAASLTFGITAGWASLNAYQPVVASGIGAAFFGVSAAVLIGVIVAREELPHATAKAVVCGGVMAAFVVAGVGLIADYYELRLRNCERFILGGATPTVEEFQRLFPGRSDHLFELYGRAGRTFELIETKKSVEAIERKKDVEVIDRKKDVETIERPTTGGRP